MAKEMLAHITDNQLPENFFEVFRNALVIGPLKIEYHVDISVPIITVDVFLFEAHIGQGVLDPKNTNLKIGGSFHGWKAEVNLAADFARKRVTYDIQVCSPKVGPIPGKCAHKKGTLFSW